MMIPAHHVLGAKAGSSGSDDTESNCASEEADSDGTGKRCGESTKTSSQKVFRAVRLTSQHELRDASKDFDRHNLQRAELVAEDCCTLCMAVQHQNSR